MIKQRHDSNVVNVTHSLRISHIQITVSDFELLHKLHSGPGDEVTLCKKRDTNRLYALRSVRLALESEQPRSEQAILKIVHRLGSPFLPKLHWTFADSERMYFVKVCITLFVTHAIYSLSN
jgi:serine/threonine protein kinase